MLAETRCGQGQQRAFATYHSAPLSDFKNVVKCIDHVLQKNQWNDIAVGIFFFDMSQHVAHVGDVHSLNNPKTCEQREHNTPHARTTPTRHTWT